MSKLKKVLEQEIFDIKIKEYLDILGYGTSFGALGLISSQVIYNLIMYNRAVLKADMSIFGEYIIEIPLLVYATVWNFKKLYNFW